MAEFSLQVVLRGSQHLFIRRPNRFALVIQGTFQGIVLVFITRSLFLEKLYGHCHIPLSASYTPVFES